MENAHICWDSYGLKYEEMKSLSYEKYENLFLEKWYRIVKKDNKSTRYLFSRHNFILQVHGCIQHENFITYINPSIKNSFINVNTAKILQVLANNFKSHRLKMKKLKILNI
jgi:hypothetical protein